MYYQQQTPYYPNNYYLFTNIQIPKRNYSTNYILQKTAVDVGFNKKFLTSVYGYLRILLTVLDYF